MKAQNFKNVGIAIFGIYTYGWNSPGRESLLDECHQNVRTLGLLTRSVLIGIVCFFCIWSESATWKMILISPQQIVFVTFYDLYVEIKFSLSILVENPKFIGLYV